MGRPTVRLAAAAIAAGSLVVALAVTSASARPAQPGRAGVAGSPISYFIADGVGKTGFRPSDIELARWALDAWRRNAAGDIRFEPAPESSALIRVYWAEPSGGEYGETRPLTVGGRRGAAVFIRPDMAALGDAIARRASADPLLRESIVYLTCVHELGHALGLEHTSDFRDIMYFFGYGGDIVQYFQRYRGELQSRGDIAKTSGLSIGDARRLKALYSAEP
jgi:hypothetical protein